ncbi:hypothetical protein HK096_000854 [Nowakowskiella sp. JEL0078]|nr:hypothetical protein HK096_000854 [Nowakowskiella sp. JEL0078]
MGGEGLYILLERERIGEMTYNSILASFANNASFNTTGGMNLGEDMMLDELEDKTQEMPETQGNQEIDALINSMEDTIETPAKNENPNESSTSAIVINNSTVAAIKKTFLVHGATCPSVSEEETPNPAAEVSHVLLQMMQDDHKLRLDEIERRREDKGQKQIEK